VVCRLVKERPDEELLMYIYGSSEGRKCAIGCILDELDFEIDSLDDLMFNNIGRLNIRNWFDDEAMIMMAEIQERNDRSRDYEVDYDYEGRRLDSILSPFCPKED